MPHLVAVASETAVARSVISTLALRYAVESCFRQRAEIRPQTTGMPRSSWNGVEQHEREVVASVSLVLAAIDAPDL